MAKSEYLQREEAAKKQLGAKGVKKRVKQLPTAARAFTREMTGIDVSRRGVSVDPMGVAMALPVGKVLKAAKALRAAGMGAKASQLEARNVAKIAGREAGKRLAKANNPATVFGVGRTGEQVLSDYIRGAQGVGKITREASEGVFPRATRSNVSEGTMNIVDTRRMNPAQAKSALEGGVSQTAKIKRRVPSAPKSVNKVTKRLLGGR